MVLDGAAVIGLHDLRPDSPTCGRSWQMDLHAGSPQIIVFPAGIVHGWYFMTDGLHLQAVSEPYAEYGADDNAGCHWSDPELGIKWPGQPLYVSARAEAFASLAALRCAMLEKEATVA